MTICECTGEKNHTIFVPNLGEKLFGQNSYFLRNYLVQRYTYVFQKYYKYLYSKPILNVWNFAKIQSN